MKEHEVREKVREVYGEIARKEGSCCCGGGCGGSEILGYAGEELAAVPEGADLGLGCGNPAAIDGLRPGEVVLDLGSGAGMDCFLAARKVGPTGRAIGVDMTPDMLAKARENARKVGAANVEFRLGEIEHLPVADASADVVISNCVINLSPDKPAVFREAFRALRPGGRIMISDIVALKEMPAAMREDPRMHGACIGGASDPGSIERAMRDAGFVDVSVRIRAESRAFVRDWVPGSGAEDYVASADIFGRKPR